MLPHPNKLVTNTAAGAMISKAVEIAIDQGLLAERDLFALNDWALVDRLERAPPTALLARRLSRRQLLKRGTDRTAALATKMFGHPSEHLRIP